MNDPVLRLVRDARRDIALLPPWSGHPAGAVQHLAVLDRLDAAIREAAALPAASPALDVELLAESLEDYYSHDEWYFDAADQDFTKDAREIAARYADRAHGGTGAERQDH
jgi:hypothetical protein